MAKRELISMDTSRMVFCWKLDKFLNWITGKNRKVKKQLKQQAQQKK
ncbi:MAG: hypothetical protein MJ135_02835 [Oscillospiraceae bacterium]|nr:hypothetical protein [Oscillospiraceae bacterium]